MVQLKRGTPQKVEGENTMKIKNVIEKPDTTTEAAAAIAPEVKAEVKPEVEGKKVPTVELPDGTVAVKNVAQKVAKELSPRAWERIDEADGKKKLVAQIVWMGNKVDYTGDMIEEYKWPNLDAKDGKKRTVTARFPKADKPDGVDEITYMGYNITIEKYGNSAVCSLADGEGVILQYVSLATVIDVLQDLINPGDTCNITWGSIDQAIKHKRGLKSRIKNLGSDDLPAKKVKKVEAPTTADNASAEAVQATGETTPVEKAQ